MGLGKIFTKKCAQSQFLRCGDYLKFLRGLGKFRQKDVTSYTFFRCGDHLKFWVGLRKVSTNISAPLHVFFLLEFLMGLGKIFTKKCAQSHVSSLWRLSQVFFAVDTRFFAVETNLSFWWDFKKFSQKSVPSHTFLRCGDYLKFLRGLGKFRQKDVTSYTCGDYLKFLMGLGKIFTKSVPSPATLGKFRQKMFFRGDHLKCGDYFFRCRLS